MSHAVKFAECAFQFERDKCDFEERMEQVFLSDYESLGWDHYDLSLEINGVDNDGRLSEDAQKFFFEEGFAKVYVNHKDKWQTHYHWNILIPFQKCGGSRRSPALSGIAL